jgi:hypothetical protein
MMSSQKRGGHNGCSYLPGSGQGGTAGHYMKGTHFSTSCVTLTDKLLKVHNVCDDRNV